MKKLISIILSALMLLSLAPAVFADGGIPCYLNGERIEKDGIIITDRTYLPVRALCERIGINVEWVEATKSVILGEKPSFTAYTGKVNIYLNGKMMENAEAVIIDGSTYLPVRAVCEEMHMNVEWNEETREVYVTYEEDLFTSPGFLALDEKVQDQLAAYLETSLPTGEVFRAHFEEMIKGDYYSMTETEQLDALKAVMREPCCIQAYSKRSEAAQKGAEFTYRLLEYDSSYDVWRGDLQPVWEYEITMDGKGEEKHVWKLISTVQDEEIIKELAEAVSFFPYTFRKHMQRLIYMNDNVNTCYGGGDTIWVKISWIPTSDFIYSSLSNCMGYVLLAAHNDIQSLWGVNFIDAAIPVSEYGQKNDTLDFGEFVRLYLSVKDDEKLFEELKEVYPNRFRLLAAILYEEDSEEYAQYYKQYQMATNFKYTGEENEAFTISIPNTNLYLTAPKSEGMLYPTFEEYTGEDNQIWTRKTYDGHSVITMVNTNRCLYAMRPHYNPVTQICTTVGGVMDGYSYVIVGEDTVYFTKDKGYLGTDGTSAILSDEPAQLKITPVGER